MIHIVEKYWRICGSCAFVYECFKLPGDFVYGEFLLSSEKTGSLAYLNAIDDITYTEVSRLLNTSEKIKNLPDIEKANILQNIFYIACDKGSDDSFFYIHLKPKCPKCNSRNPVFAKDLPKPQLVEKNIENITHKNWEKLDLFEKKHMIEIALQNYNVKI